MVDYIKDMSIDKLADILIKDILAEYEALPVEQIARRRWKPLSSGERFGQLTVIARAGYIGNSVAYKARCSCGRVSRYAASELRNGNRIRCFRTHVLNATKHKLYWTWRNMLARCATTKPKHTTGCWNRYGGRGIRVCTRWQESFKAFIDDMGPKPSDKHTLDRIDNDGNYEPDNVRWALPVQQDRNRRDNHLLALKGETRTLVEWSEHTGLSFATIASRLKRGWSIERTLSEPPHSVSTFTHRGKTQTLRAWSSETGITIKALRYRLKKGWNLKKVLERPSHPSRCTCSACTADYDA